jgi:hypothetical protein
MHWRCAHDALPACASQDERAGRHTETAPRYHVSLDFTDRCLGERLVAITARQDMKPTPGPNLASDVISCSPEAKAVRTHLRPGAGGQDDQTALGKDPQRASNGRPIYLVSLSKFAFRRQPRTRRETPSVIFASRVSARLCAFVGGRGISALLIHSDPLPGFGAG